MKKKKKKNKFRAYSVTGAETNGKIPRSIEGQTCVGSTSIISYDQQN